MFEETTLYETVRLTPFRAAILNILLVGIPLRYGLLPTGFLLEEWVQEILRLIGLGAPLGLDSPVDIQPCCLFAPSTSDGSLEKTAVALVTCINDTERQAVLDMGLTFWEAHGLTTAVALAIFWRPQKHASYTWLEFHRVYLACILLSLLLLAFFQKAHPPVLSKPPFQKWIPPSEQFNTHFFASFVFYNLGALSLSLWTLITRTKHHDPKNTLRTSSAKHHHNKSHSKSHKQPQSTTTVQQNPPPLIPKPTSIRRERSLRQEDQDEAFMKWSIPGNAIFCGAVVDILAAIAMGQALYERRVQDYYTMDPEDDSISVTARVRLAFGVRAFYTLWQGIWLLRMRSFLSMTQLRYICGYQVIRKVWLVWWIHNHAELMLWSLQGILQMGLTGIYFLGFLWAGQAEGLSAILTSEKDEDFGGRRRGVKNKTN